MVTHDETVKVCLHLDEDVHVGMQRNCEEEYSADESVFGDFDLTITVEDQVHLYNDPKLEKPRSLCSASPAPSARRTSRPRRGPGPQCRRRPGADQPLEQMGDAWPAEAATQTE